MQKEIIKVAGYFLSIGVLLSCCTQPIEKVAKPNIIWINAEDISPAFGCYGDESAITPNIDSLAKQSIVFDRAYAVSPICSPSRSTLVTGVYATSLGTQHLRSETPFPKQLSSLPELMREAGYFTSLYGKTDYNFDPEGLWDYWHADEKPWRKRSKNQPFLSVFTFNHTHEGKGNSREKYDQLMDEYPDQLKNIRKPVPVPPYFPNDTVFAGIMERYYDLVTLFDQKVGEIIDNLKADGELENTIIFIHSDHGFGLPRYKRWLNETGLKVPLIVHVPEKYRHLSQYGAGTYTSDLVSFIDFVPTALTLAGVSVPDYMQGSSFMGPDKTVSNKDFYAFRSRADNVYEMSRAVRDTQFLYVRHFMPHLPYIQPSRIFSDDKDSYKRLLQLKAENRLPDISMKMFGAKPIEELYHLKEDPMELNNLATNEKYRTVLLRMRDRLKMHALKTRDLGFLYESEMVLRAAGEAPYLLRNQREKFDLESVYEAAIQVGFADVNTIKNLLKNDDAAIQFWGIMAAWQLADEEKRILLPQMNLLRQNSSPTVIIAAAEFSYHLDQRIEYLRSIVEYLDHDIPEVVLQAARALELAEIRDEEILQLAFAKLESYKSKEGASYPYIDYNFASFISWSLEEVVKKTKRSPEMIFDGK